MCKKDDTIAMLENEVAKLKESLFGMTSILDKVYSVVKKSELPVNHVLNTSKPMIEGAIYSGYARSEKERETE